MISLVDVSGLCCCCTPPTTQALESYVTLAPNKILHHSFYVWPVFASFLFRLSSNPLHHHQTVFSVICLHFVFLQFSVTICFGVISLFVLSVCSYNLNLSNFINFTITAISCILYLFIWSHSTVVLSFYGTICFSYNISFGWFCSLH
jgi:hypothetical protein